jgi:molybdopterin-guanine dinucleotide biosynthesis protein B
MVAFEGLVRPALRKMMGQRAIHRPVLAGRLTAPLQARPGRRRYVWARAAVDGAEISVRPLRGQGTATLRSVSDANALIVIEKDTASLARGDRVRIQLLGDLETGGSRPPLFAVVGPKRAGKTTLLERLIPELQRRGRRVAVIKHDVHGFEVDREGTDTWRFTAAGAEIATLSGPDKLAIVRRIRGPISPGELADLVPSVDLILLEGYSQEAIPKIEIRRSGTLSDKPDPAGPIFSIVAQDDDVSALADRLDHELSGAWRLEERDGGVRPDG